MIPRGDEKIMCQHKGGACEDVLHTRKESETAGLDATRGRVCRQTAKKPRHVRSAESR